MLEPSEYRSNFKIKHKTRNIFLFSLFSLFPYQTFEQTFYVLKEKFINKTIVVLMNLYRK